MTSAGAPEAAKPSPDARPYRQVRVALAERAYDVLIGPGLAACAGAHISQALGCRRCAIITDRNLDAAGHLGRLRESLASAGIDVLGVAVLPPGEATKSFGHLEDLVETLIGFGIERRDGIIALGGGVIGDLTGFAAAILRRGVRFVQIPTTLLAQVDSSVGGKTAINSRQGKNLIGAFHQPSLVLADTDMLASLPDRELRAGYAEVAKHALLGDAAYFDWLEGNVAAVMARDADALVHAVARSVEMKAEIVARDETEQGDRMLLNLGHTFGHALEAWAGFSDRLLHGEAVAIGTSIALRFSETLGHCPTGTAARACAHLAAAGLPTAIAHIPQGPKPTVDELLRLMAQDKKVQGGRMTFILARGIGAAFISRDVEPDRVARCLETEIVRSA